MKKISLYDNITSGHHRKYNEEVLLNSTNTNVTFINDFSSSADLKGYKIKNELNKIRHFNKIFRKNNHIHLLYLDNMFLVLLFFSFSKTYKSKKLSGTLHWSPKNKFKKLILNYLLEKNNLKIVCHLNTIKSHFKKRENDFYVIEYPYFPFSNEEKTKKDLMLSSKIINKLGVQNNRIKILVFGATAHYKGIDILIESLKYVTNKIDIFIIGKEDFTTEQNLKEATFNKKNVNIYYHLSFVDDFTAAFIFKNVDYILIPYRNYFSGQSGPIIDALANEKKIIASEY